MFLNALEKQNPALIDAAVSLWHSGEILPDTYVIDVDQVLENARALLAEAARCNIRLYVMSKQFGRNPVLCRLLLECGFDGVVAVDFKEARQLHRHGIKVAHIGHLVQPPAHMLDAILQSHPEVITVFSLAKAREISRLASQHGFTQSILLKVAHVDDLLYRGQEGGFLPEELPQVLTTLGEMPGIDVVGVTHFPCMLFDEESQRTRPTQNLSTLLRAAEVLERQGITVRQINAPSATSCETLPQLARSGVTHAEPGHALTGTMPANLSGECHEKVAMLYLSEVSHNFAGHAYCFGGGWYRRGHLENALIVDGEDSRRDVLRLPDMASIDYCLQLASTQPVGSAVIMCFRTQVFVTRSDVALVRGISTHTPQLLGLFDSLGNSLAMENL